MKEIITLFITFTVLTNQTSFRNLQNQSTKLVCGANTCDSSNGKCTGNFGETCLCFNEYSSFPWDKPEMCNYKKKKQIYALLLELFLTFGIGHFYLGNLDIAIPKAIFFLMGYCFVVLLRTISKKTEENNTYTLLIALFGCINCVGMLIWHIIDVCLMGVGYYTDGNGVELYYIN